jgi:hypothetical protein
MQIDVVRNKSKEINNNNNEINIDYYNENDITLI